MKVRRYSKSNILFLPILVFALLSLAFTGIDKGKGGGKGSQNTPSLKAGDSYRMFINNLNIPMNRVGVMGDVSIFDPETGSAGSGGKYDGVVFLFSGGFFMSGLTNGSLWSNAVASASRIQDYVQGTVASGRNDPRAQMYVLRANEGDFAASWTEWKDAVALGAYYYDGDGSGTYDPIDVNGNGKWDPTEDRPDLIGDETVWCVYNDGTDPALRRFNDVSPQGIEVRQTVFGFNSKSFVGNMIFVRYSLLNTGTVADVMDSVYFGVWADPDLGDYTDDLVGSDTLLNAGYVYNDGDDADYGSNPPTFLIDFFQGPVSYIPGVTFIDNNNNGVWDEGIDTPVMNGHNVQGQVRGIANYPGATNLGLSSFVHYIQSHPTHGDPNTRQEARNYMLGRNRVGVDLNPCNWEFGEVRGGVACADVNPKFSYSGNPVTNVGWINNGPNDQRQMSNTGPFKLEKNKPVDIVVAYVVGRGNNALNSITVAKQYSEIAQTIFDSNFPSPPPPPPARPTTKTGADDAGNGFIDIQINTSDLFKYSARDTVLAVNKRVKGIYLTAYRTNSKQQVVNGVDNSQLLATYVINDSLLSLYELLGNGNQNLKLADPGSGYRLDSVKYADPDQGRIRVRVSVDPFTGNPLVLGKNYYFTATVVTVNHEATFLKSAYDRDKSIVYGPAGDYIVRSGGIEEYETAIIPVYYGENIYAPATTGSTAQQSGGASSGQVKYVVVENDKLTGDNYSVEFKKNNVSRKPYKVYYSLRNTTKGTTLIDSSAVFDTNSTDISGKVQEGFILKIKSVEPSLGTTRYSNATRWYDNFSATSSTGIFYGGDDITIGATRFGLPRNATTNPSTVISADRLRQVQIVFDAANPGKAYRYLMGFSGNNFTRDRIFRYAEGVAAADTTNRGPVGKLGEGFVDVPFKAYVSDPKTGEKRQLAVGFIETSSVLRDPQGRPLKGTPDGIWDPGDSVLASGEMILLFDGDYDATGSQIQYKGGNFSTGVLWADVNQGFAIPAGATINGTAVTDDQRKIAASPYFNMLYAVGLQRKDATSFFANGDTLTIPVSVYPYTDNDKFTFTTKSGGNLTQDEKQSLFNKVNVFPNPLLGVNPAGSFNNQTPDNPYVTFSNLPTDVTIKIYSLSGILVRTLGTADKLSPTSPFLRWNLENESGLRVASGMYIALVTAPGFGEKILKFGIILPQKQIQRF
ncbi:MAG: hypothetical protein HUU43_04155 [Ignavibacteriaceae bacterium]|nr:hypothetical protein [Ignavibacteriaceae bacterium]